MKEEQQKEAVNIAISENNVEKDVAERIKKEFDKRHGPTWHCIIGRNFEIFIDQSSDRAGKILARSLLPGISLLLLQTRGLLLMSNFMHALNKTIV
ncbi:hypothetical protein GOBAR_DD18922 [Gossypium barbadense]|nr:hypothetical protein GOBAR_DD18922 [Gossypium barbadense]